ncbi:MAG: hypothetical protein HQ521_07330, partial [Bacteroidetes bacterium]|nr:hypothetical protein [Bacteroidota bacterium]
MEQQYQNTPQAFEEDSLDLRKYFYLIRANWYWFIPSLFLALAIAFMVNRYTMPTYNVRASLLLNEGSSAKGLSGYENVIPGMEIYGQRRYAVNEMEILKSYSLAYKTVQQLDFGISYAGIGRSGLKEVVMYNNCPFYVEMDSSKNNLYGYSVEIRPVSETEYEVFVDDQYEIRETLKYGEAFNSIPFNFTIQLKNPENFLGGYGKYSFKFNSPNSLANIYKNKLTISSNDERRGGVLYL